MNVERQRGSTLVIALLMLVVLLGLAATMTFSAQSQAKLAAGVKLQQFYETAANSGFNRVRAELSDYWVNPDPLGDSADDWTWRFGQLLSDASDKEDNDDTANGNFPFGDSSPFSPTISMNAGMLDLTHKVWVYNNTDDPATFLANANFDGETMNKNWDTDGRIILTVEVYSPSDTTTPMAVQSAVVGVAGVETTYLHGDSVREGDESDVGGQGTGTKGSASRIEIESLDE